MVMALLKHYGRLFIIYRMKKVLLIGDSPISMSPYLMSYIEIFDKNNIQYELLFWNKTMEDPSTLPTQYIPYNKRHDNSVNGFIKIVRIEGFSRFVKQYLKRNDYAYVVVFTIAHALFLYNYLSKHYKDRFVFDIRDYSPLCKLPFCKKIIRRLIDYSAFTVLSSKGFLRWLPCNNDTKIVITHNTLLRAIDSNPQSKKTSQNGILTILTIGQIAYYESQLFFINQMSEAEGVVLHFAGSGPAVPRLKAYVRENGIKNVVFSGRYDKIDEPAIVQTSDFINIWLKSDINADSCMANRFYLSSLFGKPMIVHKGTYMADLCTKYGLGVVLDESENFGATIKQWREKHDNESFTKGCKEFLQIVKHDLSVFENKLLALYRYNN